MDRDKILRDFNELKKLVSDYGLAKKNSREEAKKHYNKILEQYGRVAIYYKKITGDLQVEVPVQGSNVIDKYPNYFEAGYLSGRTYHQFQAFAELNKVIGIFESEALSVSNEKEQISIVLNRFRPCCNYIKFSLDSEKDVQNILWIMLRSNFQKVEREETFKKFGLKNYRPDFGLPDFKSLIEVKYINDKTDPKKIQEEILADIEGYLNKNDEYDDIFVFIYDKSHKLMDSEALITDLKSTNSIKDAIVIPGIKSRD